MYKVILEVLDNKPITKRTGKSRVNAIMETLPEEGGYHKFLYDEEDCKSPGIFCATDCVEQNRNEIKFLDINKRPFKVTIKE